MFALALLVAQAATIDVAGVGPVPLAEATAACLDSAALTVTTPREAVFPTVAKGVMALTEDLRTQYFHSRDGDSWPSRSIELTYPQAVPVSSPGRIAACTAVGVHWIERGMALKTACSDKKSVCKAFVGEADWPVMKDLIKRADAVVLEQPDALFIGMRTSEVPVAVWQDPLPFLQAACDGPKVAAESKQLIDAIDLKEARRGCLQLLTLAEGKPPGVIDPADCKTPWADTSADVADLVVLDGTTLHVGPRVGSGHLKRIRWQLAGMDPTPALCGSRFGDVWRRTLVKAWRESQSTAACADEALSLDDRAALCPRLIGTTQTRCLQDDAPSCMMVATMITEGFGIEPDPRTGVELFERACKLGDETGCSEVRSRQPAIEGWIDAALMAAEPAPQPVDPAEEANDDGERPPVLPQDAHKSMADARALVDAYAERFGPEWVGPLTGRLVQAAVDLWDVSLANELLEIYAEQVPSQLKRPTARRLAEITKRLAQIEAAEEKARLEEEKAEAEAAAEAEKAAAGL